MTKEVFPQGESSKEIPAIENPRKLFMLFTGLKKKKIEEMGYTITEEQKNVLRKNGRVFQ